jgi:hypothetical protein
MMNQGQWVIWNGSLGILDLVGIGQIEGAEGGRTAVLAAPYGVVGPFSLDELETRGRISFGECLVMSRRRWQEDQVVLRCEARDRLRASGRWPTANHRSRTAPGRVKGGALQDTAATTYTMVAVADPWGAPWAACIATGSV